MPSSTRPASDTEKLKRRNRELSILNAIAEALNREVDLARALQVALAKVAKLLDLRAGWRAPATASTLFALATWPAPPTSTWSRAAGYNGWPAARAGCAITPA